MSELTSPFREAFLASFDDRHADLFRRLGLWMAERVAEEGLTTIATPLRLFRGLRDDLADVETELGRIALPPGTSRKQLDFRLAGAARNLRSDLRDLIFRMDTVLEGGADPGSRPR